MLQHRIIAVAVLLVVAGAFEATAQIVGFPPQSSSVCSSFTPMREEAERVIGAINAAQQRKAPREEFCQLFQRLLASTGKMAKFLEQHKATCNVPNEALVNSKNEYTKTLAMRKNACSTAPAAVQGPNFSDVLGAPLPETSTNKPDMGTFNTMTGNPLTR